jgi:hypothetical protein
MEPEEEDLMPRGEARIFSAIWAQADWRALTPEAQWTYMMLLSQADLAQDGVISLRVPRWSKMATGVTVEEMHKRLDELASANWIVIDEMTGELLVRSLIRWDRVYLQPNVMRAAVAHLSTVESKAIRRAIHTEMVRIVEENTDEVRAAHDLRPLTGEQKNVINKAIHALRATGDGVVVEGPAKGSEKGSAKGSEMGSPNPLGDRGKGLGVEVELPTRAREPESGAQSDALFPDPDPERVLAATGSPAHRGQVAAFDEFWDIYPRRVAKEAARKAWASAIKKADVETILAGARRYRDDPAREPEFTAHPSTWLNQGRWGDEPMPTRSQGSAGQQPDRLTEAARLVEERRQRRDTADPNGVTRSMPDPGWRTRELTDGRR